MKIKIKPLSVNDAWQGRRFKTKKYKSYEEELLYKLRPLKIPEKIRLDIDVGYSNKCSDIDNCLKPLLDVLQKKYGFNDRNIYELKVKKSIIKKGQEYIDFEFIEL